MTVYDSLITLQKVMANLEDDKERREDLRDLVRVYKSILKSNGGWDNIHPMLTNKKKKLVRVSLRKP